MKYLAILTVRNEGAFLLEWLAHHRAVGFTDFLVYSNDCDDGTGIMLDRLDAMGVITHIHNDGPHDRGVQWAALKHADKHPQVKAADWIVPLDIDEFVNIQAGDHTLNALLAALPDATAITLTWRFFGNAGIIRYQDKLICEQFVQAAPAVMYWPWRASMFKTLFRNDGTYRKLGVHRPKSPVEKCLDQARWFDGHGRELDERIKRNRLFSPFGRDNYGLVQLNHYALGAMESYVLKRDRGRSNRNEAGHGMSYWVERNWCTDQDKSIAGIAPMRDRFLADFKADSTLEDLHQKSVRWREKRFETLMKEEPFRALFGRLLTTPPSRPLTMQQARPLLQLAQRHSHRPH